MTLGTRDCSALSLFGSIVKGRGRTRRTRQPLSSHERLVWRAHAIEVFIFSLLLYFLIMPALLFFMACTGELLHPWSMLCLDAPAL